MEETSTISGRHWDAYFSALHLAKEKEPTQWTMQVTVHWVLWFCDVYQCPWCYSCMASIVVDHLVEHGVEEKWISIWSRAMYCLCWTTHIVWVQHQFQMTPETQTQSHVVHTCSILIQAVEIPTKNHKGKNVGIYSPHLLNQLLSLTYCAQWLHDTIVTFKVNHVVLNCTCCVDSTK